MSKYISMEETLTALEAGEIGPKKAMRILCDEFGSPVDKALTVVFQILVWRQEALDAAEESVIQLAN